MVESGCDLFAEVEASGQLIAIAKDRIDTIGGRATVARGTPSSQLFRNAVCFERSVQPLRPRFIVMTVADERPVLEVGVGSLGRFGGRGSVHGRPPRIWT